MKWVKAQLLTKKKKNEVEEAKRHRGKKAPRLARTRCRLRIKMRSMRGIERRWKRRWKDRNGKSEGDEENEDM